jgi:NAD(P)-dependent dehydrogenase (short-subunit alcohol dehydrogenase family)
MDAVSRSPDLSQAEAAVWLVTGCSTGIGREIARAALEAGHRVAVTARDAVRVADLAAEFPGQSLALTLDVTEREQVEAAVRDAEVALGPIDVLVNNAGYGYVAALEEGEDEEVRRMFDTNYFGVVDMIKAVLPSMRGRRSGYIVNISSMTGLVSNPGALYYSSSKFAMESLSEGLRKELAPFDIRVSVVEPGAFRTDWGSRSMQESQTRIEDYEATVGVRRELMRSGAGAPHGDPRRVGDAVVMLAGLEDPPLHLLIGPDVYDAFRAKLRELDASLTEWESVTLDV